LLNLRKTTKSEKSAEKVSEAGAPASTYPEKTKEEEHCDGTKEEKKQREQEQCNRHQGRARAKVTVPTLAIR
jgi:hypothetical protein